MAAFDFKPGHAMLDAQNFEAAIEFFGGALQQHIEKHGDMDPRTAPAYLEYGNALLEQEEAKSSVFGSGMGGKGNEGREGRE